ncbi:MAG: hypothetical protein ACQEQQ_07995 [Chloroflexota bacterium]
MGDKKSKVPSSILRYITIGLMSLTAAFTLLSGVGTTCVALAAEKFGSMSVLAPYKWLYMIFVLLTLVVGILGVRSSIMLIKGRPSAYRSSLLALILGILVGGAHIIASRRLRGSSMPVDAVVYTTLITLIVFLFLRIPKIRDRVNLEDNNQKHSDMAGGISAFVVSGFILSIQYWMTPSHTIQGTNYANAFQTSLMGIGIGLGLCGMVLIVRAALSPPPYLKDISVSK